jgi:hypothetical protein
MVACAYTQTDRVVGTLTNGRKIVSTTVTVTDAGEEITQITVPSLKKIIAYVPSYKTSVATAVTSTIANGTLPNQFAITAGAGGIDGAVIEVISVGV